MTASPTEVIELSLTKVWNQRDPAKRLAALGELYASDAVLYEPDNDVVGLEAISETIGKVLASLPDGFQFEVASAPAGHHGLAVAHWRGGPPGQVIVTGSDIARIEDGKVRQLWVFFDPPAA